MRALATLPLLIALSASAQTRPIFDPDDFVDPRHLHGPIFISRLVAGAMRSAMDDYRPLRQDAGFLHLTNSFYWSRFQVDYKHSEVRGENTNGAAHVDVCPCDPPVYFQKSTDPLPGSKDSLQFAWYRPKEAGPADPPVMLRTRISISRQGVDTIATYLGTDHRAFRLHGAEWSLGVDQDMYYRILGHDLFGTLQISRMERSGTAFDRSQTDVVYISRFPAKPIGKVLVRGALAIGGITGSKANGVNVINPAFELYFHEWTTQANFHLVWSPTRTRIDQKSWVTHHQVLLSVDRSIYIKLLASH